MTIESLAEVEQLIALGAWIQVVGAVARILTPMAKGFDPLWSRLPDNFKWAAPATFAFLASAGSAALLTESWPVFATVVVSATVTGSLSAMGLYHGPSYLGGNPEKNASAEKAASMQGLKTSSLHKLLFLAALLLVAGCARPCSARSQSVTMASCAAAVSALTLKCERGDKAGCERRDVVLAGCDAMFVATEAVCSE